MYHQRFARMVRHRRLQLQLQLRDLHQQGIRHHQWREPLRHQFRRRCREEEAMFHPICATGSNCGTVTGSTKICLWGVVHLCISRLVYYWV
jgi:Xaa-Pro aminopeptidase